MQTTRRAMLLVVFCAVLSGCLALSGSQLARPQPSKQLTQARAALTDKAATPETAALFANLRALAGRHVLFGHQNDTRKGYGWTKDYQAAPVPPGKSDVREVTGAYPAVYGWDLESIAGFYTGPVVEHEKQLLRQLTIDAYNRGGINTYSWHYNNPVSKVSVNWRDSPVEAVARLLPGGSHHRVFTNSLREIAAYANSLIGADGRVIPIIFRPFHEMDGDWFWWGKSHCTAPEYQQLYQFTVTYLRDSLQVHSFLYAWSPDRNFANESQLLERYPGDAYVDVVGLDNYGDLRPDVLPEVALQKMKLVANYAARHQKVAALTETGLENVSDPAWYTQRLLPLLGAQPGPAYCMVWSNSTKTFWTPPLTHPAAPDFRTFQRNALPAFGGQLPSFYTLRPQNKSTK
ncbi:glycoside hydrolase family 26 protein [Hymenobacter glacialis]|nr:glycosyl hydrolase [Hymenobacter glacialis]